MSDSIILIDNYDSFTYNLQHYFLELGADCSVFRNDQINSKELADLKPSALVFSPGPGVPSDAGNMMRILESFHSKIPILGICLGHQAIGEWYGAELELAIRPVHGKTSMVHLRPDPILMGYPNRSN